jgi:hypothetical protein
MQKVDGVDAVKVSLKDGLTVIDLRPDNRVTLAAIRQVIKNNGFVSKEANVRARGESSENGRQFVVSGTSERLELSAPAARSGDEWRFAVTAPSKR